MNRSHLPALLRHLWRSCIPVPLAPASLRGPIAGLPRDGKPAENFRAGLVVSPRPVDEKIVVAPSKE